MKTKLHPVSDFITRYTDHLWSRTRECIAEAGSVYSVMSYIKNGREFSIPITYDGMVVIGKEMQAGVESSAKHISGMGPVFGFVAMELASRSDDRAFATEDRNAFSFEVENLLHHIMPDAFFVSMPIRMIVGPISASAEIAAAGPGHPAATDAIVVIGRNKIREYAVITPFSVSGNGQFGYGKPCVIDSFSGGSVIGLGPFSGLYEPSRN